MFSTVFIQSKQDARRKKFFKANLLQLITACSLEPTCLMSLFLNSNFTQEISVVSYGMNLLFSWIFWLACYLLNTAFKRL